MPERAALTFPCSHGAWRYSASLTGEWRTCTLCGVRQQIFPSPPDDEPWVAYDIECGECGVVYIWEPTYADQPLPDMCPACAEALLRSLRPND